MVLLKEVSEGIWGLSFGPNNTSDVVIDNPVRLTMAALEIDDDKDSGSSTNGITRVTIKSSTADKGPPTDLILCNLHYPSCLQQPLDIEFFEGQTVTFGVKGPYKIHLTGYILQSEPHEMCEEGHMHGGSNKHGIFETADDSDSEDDDDDDDDEDDDDDDESDDDDDGNVLNQFKLAKRHKLRDDEDQDLEGDYEDGFVQGEDQLSSDTSASSDSDDDDAQPKASASIEKGKKRARSESNGHQKKQEPQTKKNKNVKEEPTTTTNETESKKAKKLANKAATSSNDTSAATSTTTTTKKNSNSLEINDLRVGNGPEAKLGKTVAVYYTGRLQSNNKVFDSLTNGKPFRFRLGAGEVIRGWDQGVKGMRVGGKRRLTIPPALAYGSKKLPDIPANSTLVFDVEVKNVF